MKKLPLILAALLLMTLCACYSGHQPEEAATPQPQIVVIKAAVMDIKDVCIMASPVSAGSGATAMMTVYTPDSVAYTDPNGNAVERSALKQGQTIEISYMGYPTDPYPEELNADKIQILENYEENSGAEPDTPALDTGSLQFSLGQYACEVTIPSEWTGIYDYRIYDDGSGLEFLSVNNSECGGVAFAIWAVSDEAAADPEFFSLCSDESKVIDSDLTNGVTFYLVHPYTDVEYDYENEGLTAEYNTILSGEESVIRSFQWLSADASEEEDESSLTFMVEGQSEKVPATTHSLDNCSIRVPSEGWVVYDDENTDGSGPMVFTPIDNNEVSLSLSILRQTGLDSAKSQYQESGAPADGWENWKAVPGGGESCRCSYTSGDRGLTCYLVECGQDTVCLFSQCPIEALEGFGARMNTIANTLKLQ